MDLRLQSSSLVLFIGLFALGVACSGDGTATGGTDSDTQSSATMGSTVDPTSSNTDATDPTGTMTTAGPGTDSIGTMGTDSDTTDGTDTSMPTTMDPTTAGTTVTSSGTDTEDDPVVAVSIEPVDPVLHIYDGMLPDPVDFKAIGMTMGGDEVELSGTWTYTNLDIATIGEQTGQFAANGQAGGVGTVAFDAGGGLQAATSATIKMHITDDPGIDPEIKDDFGGAVDPDPSMTLVYPYNETVFPRGLTGPVIQWNGGNPNDTYYIHAESETFEFEGWGQVPPPSRYSFPAMPTDVWLKLTASTEGTIQVDIQRHDGNQAYLAETQTWTIAPANLTGTIYYWEINTGNVVRLKPGDTGPENFIQKPPGISCVACHSVSKDGSTIAASFHGGWSPWGTIDSGSGEVLHNSEISSGFQAISPNGSHVLWGHWDNGGFGTDNKLSLSEYNSNTELAALTVNAPGTPSHPAWSGDGEKVAFSMRTDGNGLDFTQSNLWITGVDLMNPSFFDATEIVVKSQDLPTTTFPTFSPDSQWIAFERASQARARGGRGEIWMTNLDGSTMMRLDRANGLGAITPEQQQTNFEPTFMPVSVGGYFWLVVGSERQYGNILTDTNPNSRRKQLWVTAIKANPEPGEDPSNPAFWLPGQELDNQNMRGEWALSPCKNLGESCQAGFDCCDGFCYSEQEGEDPMCQETPMGCSQLGDACEEASDCCDEQATCTFGFCTIIPG